MNFSLGQVITERLLVVISPPAQTVTFGKVISSGLPFSATVTATSGDSTDVVTLTAGTLPAGVSNIAIAKTVSSGVTSFVVTGLLNYSTNQTTVVIPVNATNGFMTVGGNITLNVVPEPTALLTLGAIALITRRRRDS